MAHKQMQRPGLGPSAPQGASNGNLPPGAADRIRELLAGRHSKSALQLAKDLHKQKATVESESLLVEAYRCRIEDLIQMRMTVEAKALIAIVRERFPAAVLHLDELEQELCAVEGRLDGIVGALRNPELAPAERERIETFVRQRIDDLTALATVGSLPPEHSFRCAASALAAAFQKVTEGKIDGDLLALPEVSRRSPLGSWKALVRAIACYYGHEDDECRKWLEAIAADSVPARLASTMTAMLNGKTEGQFSPAEARLIEAAGDHGAALRSSLAVLESALAAKKKQPILAAVRTVMSAGVRLDAGVRERLRQHITVHCLMRHISRGAIDSALGGPPKLDAYFYRLLARSLEDAHFAESSAEAVIVWEEFRRAAIREKWFAAGGLEDGVLSLHSAEIVTGLPADIVEEMGDREFSASNSDRDRKGAGLPSAKQLYERACQADASREAFASWLGWAKKQPVTTIADEVAKRWCKARPGEVPPLLHLMESAEKRSALKKALKYLEEAEHLDRLNPSVRRAKARLLISAALRHLGERKTHLVQAEIEQLLAVPEIRQGDVAALAAALGWCCASLDKYDAVRQERETELIHIVGPVAAHLLLSALDKAAHRPMKALFPQMDARRTPPAELLAGAVRICLLGDWIGLPIPLLFGWTGKMIEALHQLNGSADAAQLLVLGEAALADSARELAYAVSHAGLAPGNAEARFLFLRARALPDWVITRRKACLEAALELARRQRDMELAGKILDRLGSRRFEFGTPADPLSQEMLDEIIQEEQKLKKYPAKPRDDWPLYGARFQRAASTPCDCPKCRARRGEAPDHRDGDDEWDVGDQDGDELDDPLVKGIPAALAAVIESLPPADQEQVMKALEAGESPLEMIRRIDEAVRRLSPASQSRTSKRKTPKPSWGNLDKDRKNAAPDQPPIQGTLF